MEVTSSSQMLVDFQQAIWHYIPEDRTLNKFMSAVSKHIIFIIIYILRQQAAVARSV
jgi:hypothetical protein